MRILILGSSGLLGTALVEQCGDAEVFPAASRDADIRDPAQVRRLVEIARPDWIVLAAAFTDVDACEREPERAFAVNRDGAKNVAIAAREAGAKLAYLSTDYVFDGQAREPYEPDAPVHPLNVYGASKAAGEKAVQEHAAHWLIARTSWLFGPARPCFPEKILLAAESQAELRVVNNQVGSPTYTKHLAQTIRDLIRKQARGLLNIANAGSCSWFDFAQETLRKAGKNTPIFPISTAETHRAAKRPAYSVLSPAPLAAFGISLPRWQDALDAYIADLRERGKLRS